MLCAAITAGVFVSGEVQTLRQDLSQNPSLAGSSDQLAQAGWSDPQTLLLVGDDQRALTKYYHVAVLPHSNEMLLVRIDPSKPWISMMSIPRELRVKIYPPHSKPITTRFNYAYTAGGIPLLLSTVKRVLGLSVNHVMVITFGRFKRAVDRMGCVYTTVDRRYYHANVPGGEQYQEIDLQPGYQKLCGDGALQFVSYRHSDTSVVRDARDQSFLLDVKKQYGPTLADNVHKFEQIFGEAVQTDPSLHTTNGLLNLLGTLISSSGRRVRQVHFKANLLANYDTASPQQIAQSVHSFLYGVAAQPKHSTANLAHKVNRGQGTASLPLIASSAEQLARARSAAADVPFTYEFPKVQDRGGAGGSISFRSYLVHAPDNKAYPIYTAVFGASGVGDYYDVQGTTWSAAPQFDNPDQTVRVPGRTYYMYYEGDHLKMVAWSEHGAIYWVRNTLTDALSNGELLAIAEQTQPVGEVTGGSGGPGVRLKPAAVPTRTTSQLGPSTVEMIGSVAALMTLLAVPLVALLLIKRRGELRILRAELRMNEHLQAKLHSAIRELQRPAQVREPPPAVRRPVTPGGGRGRPRGA